MKSQDLNAFILLCFVHFADYQTLSILTNTETRFDKSDHSHHVCWHITHDNGENGTAAGAAKGGSGRARF